MWLNKKLVWTAAGVVAVGLADAVNSEPCYDIKWSCHIEIFEIIQRQAYKDIKIINKLTIYLNTYLNLSGVKLGQ